NLCVHLIPVRCRSKLEAVPLRHGPKKRNRLQREVNVVLLHIRGIERQHMERLPPSKRRFSPGNEQRKNAQHSCKPDYWAASSLKSHRFTRGYVALDVATIAHAFHESHSTHLRDMRCFPLLVKLRA